MLYYKVTKEYGGIKVSSKRNLYLINNELFTKKKLRN